MKGARPTHKLKVYEPDTKAWAVVGAGWLNSDGSVSVKMSPGGIISYGDQRALDLKITLWPIDKLEEVDAT